MKNLIKDMEEDIVHSSASRYEREMMLLITERMTKAIDMTDENPSPPSTCPNCGCDDLNCSHSNHEDELIWRDYHCLHCDVTWREFYRFTSYELL